MIYLLYNSPWNIGGSTAFTVHLAKVLGNSCQIIRSLETTRRTEHFTRKLGEYGLEYQMMCREDILKLDGPVLLTASSPKYDCTIPGMWSVFHDPNEFWLYPHWKTHDRKRVICIRETGLVHFPKAKFIPHPYVRQFRNSFGVPTMLANSIARVSAVKNADWILEANEHLDQPRRVRLFGQPDRFWLHHKKILETYKSTLLEGPFARTFGEDARISREARYSVDLTKLPEDGGGTQYSFLAAMDAGAIPIMTMDWASYPGPARKFGITVGNGDDLLHALEFTWDESRRREQAEANWRYLAKTHNPDEIKKAYLETLK